MKSNFKVYDHTLSIQRIKDITSSSDNSFEEVDRIPSVDKLTFSNGFYVNCTAIACDIRGSSDLTSKYKRPKLAKLIKAYISECVAVQSSSSCCREVFIEGDCVWSIYNTPSKQDIDDAFSTLAKLHSMIKFLNYYSSKNGFDPIDVGIGCSYGRALMIKAGYAGSGINEVTWLGDVVNEAHFLCSKASKKDGYYSKTDPIYVSKTIYSNLNDHNSKLVSKVWYEDYYSGNVVNTAMNDYYVENCK